MTRISKDSPCAQRVMRALLELGGTASDARGGATAKVVERMAHYGYTPSAISGAVAALDEAGLLTRKTAGKRTYVIDVTSAGRVWAQRLDLVVDMPEPPSGQQLAMVDAPAAPAVQTLAEKYQAAHVAPQEAPAAPPAPEVSAEDIARAMLRQTTRLLADTDVSTLMAERDALRAHNEVLVQRVAALTAERDQVSAEMREVRSFLHELEVKLTPVLAGPDAKLDWLDARTRTDLLRVVGEAASWAS
jgi:DNA-binding MarR family transcriptional regulator